MKSGAVPSWSPACSLETLKLRARVLQDIRDFFVRLGVLEVETPVLSAAATTDPQIDSFVTRDGQGRPRYLHTSPEFPMKRLLAAGAGSIYQVCRVFRQGESGRYHNPEFTLLEWYRLGFDHHRLMDEMVELLARLFDIGRPPVIRMSYAEAFERLAGIDPHAADVDILAGCARQHGIELQNPAQLTRDQWLDLLISEVVSPRFLSDALTFIYDYPASQAALARVRPGAPPVAERFELYWGHLELANGFHELSDAAEQRHRFEQDVITRQAEGRGVPMDENLLQALEAGLPGCAGVALGLDRLLMAISGAGHIDQVLAFPYSRA